MVLHETGNDADLVVARAFRSAAAARSEAVLALKTVHRTRKYAGQHDAPRGTCP